MPSCCSLCQQARLEKLTQASKVLARGPLVLALELEWARQALRERVSCGQPSQRAGAGPGGRTKGQGTLQGKSQQYDGQSAREKPPTSP